MARLPPLRSQPACRQDRVVASGADAFLGRQVEERHRNIKERLRQMEAQLEENKKELLWVRVLMGRPRPGQRRGLGGGQFCCLCRSGLCRRVCVYSPVCWSRHPTLGAGPDVVTRRWWAGARGSPRSKRLLVALTSQAGELLGIQLDLTSAPQTNLRVTA